jgi:hypothetical protein
VDFVRNYFFTNATLTSCPLFFILSSNWGGFAAALLLHPPKSDDKMKKKWVTGQSCIRKEVTSYKLHTWGHSMTTWTQFWPFLTTTYLYVDIFNPERGQK